MEVTGLLSVSLILVYMYHWASFSQALADDCLAPVRWERREGSFWFTSQTNGCDSLYNAVFTTTYKVNNTTYKVAALLCSHTRYKLLIKDTANQNNSYLDIAWRSHGNGEDHCELVGANNESRSYIKVATPDESIRGLDPGYSRDGWAQPFKKHLITRRKSPRWYECGISIPSSQRTHEGCNVDENESTDKKEEKKTKPDSTPAVSLSVFKVIGTIIAAFLGFSFLIYISVKCIQKGVPYIRSKLCAGEDIPPATSLSSTEPTPRPYSEAAVAAPPGAQPHAPPWGVSAPSDPPSETWEEGAPPTYEEAVNYPLVRAAEASPLPYKDPNNV